MSRVDNRLKSNRFRVIKTYNLYTQTVYFFQSSKIVGYVFLLLIPVLPSKLLDLNWLFILSLSIFSIGLSLPLLLLSFIGIKERYFFVTYEYLRTYYLENNEIVFYKPNYIKTGLFAILANFIELLISGFLFLLGIKGVITLFL